MDPIPPKYRSTVSQAVARILTRAENSRGLEPADLAGRIAGAVEKYVLRDDPAASGAEIKEFIDAIRADDLCLIIACEKGDERAWEDLVAGYDPAVRSAAWKYAKNREDAEDLAGSIWAELHGLKLDKQGVKKSKLAYYSGRGSLAGWLRAVTNQLAIDQFRRMKRLVQIEEPREFENLARDSREKTDHQRIVPPGRNPEEILSENRTGEDLATALSAAVADLGEEDRLILKLYYFEGLKLKEIARTFGFHEATASRKLARVQSEIRNAVERILAEKHGWKKTEIETYLTSAATAAGLNLERLFQTLLVLIFLQEVLSSVVL